MTVTLKSYRNRKGLSGNSGSTAVFIGDWANRNTDRDTLLTALDANDNTLICTNVEYEPLDGDVFSGKAELTCTFAPPEKAPQTDDAMRIRWEVSGESVTISGNFTWSGGDPIVNVNVLPTKQIALIKCIVSGVKSSWSLSTIASLIDHVNNASWQGAAAETILFHGCTVSTRQDEDGDTVYEIEYELLYKPSGWNKFYRESTGTWVEIVKTGTSDKVYETATFTNLEA